MVRGQQVLSSLDNQLDAAERDARAQQAEADALVARLDALRAEEAAALRDLAKVRVELLGEAAALGRLDAAETRAQAILASRHAAIADADRALSGARADVATLAAMRDAALQRQREGQAAAQAALGEARQRLASDPAWVAQRRAAEEADSIADRARQKAGFARDDLATKGQPYLADPLFAYLWKRGYGTPAYSAFPLVRMLDGWVAAIARFEPARRDYAMLSDLPVQLEAHAARMEAAADAADTVLAEMESRAAGLAPGQDPAGLAQALAEAEAALASAQAGLATAEASRNALAAGQDDSTREATAALESALSQAPLQALRDAAARTPTRNDDEIVARLDQAARERAEIDRRLPQERGEADAAWRRLEELRALRREAGQRGVDQGGFDMATGAAVGVLIGQVLQGALSRGGFFDRLGERQAPGGGMSTGPWGNPNKGQQDSPWGGAAPGPWGGLPNKKRRKGGGFASPDGGWGGGGGGFGGGGFSTGGGMDSGSSGGGFKTGGGF